LGEIVCRQSPGGRQITTKHKKHYKSNHNKSNEAKESISCDLAIENYVRRIP